MKTMIMLFWVLATCRLVGRCQGEGETYCIYLSPEYGDNVSPKRRHLPKSPEHRLLLLTVHSNADSSLSNSTGPPITSCTYFVHGQVQVFPTWSTNLLRQISGFKHLKKRRRHHKPLMFHDALKETITYQRRVKQRLPLFYTSRMRNLLSVEWQWLWNHNDDEI